MAGTINTATTRRTSSALPSTASTAGPGSAFHGSAVSNSALVSRMSFQVASRPRCGKPAFHAAVVSCTTSTATAASRLSGSGAGPIPPLLDPTTVATLDTRLPRLLARSALYRLVIPSAEKSPSDPSGTSRSRW